MQKSAAKERWAIAAIAAILASPLTIVALVASWDANPHGFVHAVARDGTLIIHWRAWLLVGANRFIPVFVSACALGAFIRAAVAAAHGRAA